MGSICRSGKKRMFNVVGFIFAATFRSRDYHTRSTEQLLQLAAAIIQVNPSWKVRAKTIAGLLVCLSGSAPVHGAHPPLAPPDIGVPREWNGVIREFLSATGLTQAVRGLDADMVIMNPIFERDVVPGALDNLLDSLVVSYTFRIPRASSSLILPDH